MLYRFALYLIRTLLLLRCKLIIEGMEHVPAEGGGILLANHRSVLDPLIIGSTISKRNIRYMAKKELFDIFLLKNLIRKVGAFPVDRNSADLSFMRKVVSLLSREKELVLIFGEGTRNLDLSLPIMPLKTGFAFLAKRAKVPVIPVYVTGINDLLKPKLRPKLMVSFAEPYEVNDHKTAIPAIKHTIEALAKHHQSMLKSTWSE